MTTSEIAAQLVALCKQGQFAEAHTTLYAADAISIEPDGAPMKQVQGMDAIRQKGEFFQNNVKAMHGMDVSEPLVAGNVFSLRMAIDFTDQTDKRLHLEEICVYHVKDGKIVREEFFFA